MTNFVINQCTFGGPLIRDPKVTTYGSDGLCTSFTIPVKQFAKGQVHDDPIWLEVCYFGPLAKLAAKQLMKGARVVVTGSLYKTSWVDKSGNHNVSMKLQGTQLAIVDWLRDNSNSVNTEVTPFGADRHDANKMGAPTKGDFRQRQDDPVEDQMRDIENDAPF